MSTKKTIMLIASDLESLEVDEPVALQLKAIADMIKKESVRNEIPLPNVTGKTLAKVIDYCKKHVDADSLSEEKKEELKKWDAEFMNTDQLTLFDLTMAANYLDIKSLLDLTCQTVADIIKDKSMEEIRTTFNLKNEFTPEEEAEVRRENQWAFE